MKKLFVFLVGMMLFLQHGNGQFKRHYWLNPRSVNHTLSYPTSNGEWMLAAARQHPNSTLKNTIAVFRLDNAYNIRDSRVIGRYFSGEDFDRSVNFEIHCIVESFNPTGYYIICGSMSGGATAATIGVVFVLDAGLNPQHMREYPDVRNFYSAYAQDGYFFVCGQTQSGQGIVLRDDVASPQPSAQVWITQDSWDFQKIRVRNNPGSGQIKISGTGFFQGDDGDEFQTMGYSVFDVGGGSFTPAPNNPPPPPHPPLPPNSFASWQFPPIVHGIGSKVVIANHPGGAGGEGVILSVSDNYNIYTYLFFQHPALNAAFRVPCSNGKLEDMECAGPGGGVQTSQIAWVGNKLGTDENPQQTAYYLHMNIPMSFTPPPPYPYPPFPPTPTTFTYFHPFPAADNAYYSLHKVQFHRNQGDLQFHCGGYYQHYNGNKATFAVTPDLIGVDGEDTPCITREGVRTVALDLPDLYPLLFLDIREIGVRVHETSSKKYRFCNIECEGELQEGNDCGNKLDIIIIDSK